MEKIITVAQVIAPIFAAIFLGVLARKKALLTPEENRGLQQFVMKIALPCVIFNSCLSAKIGAESVGTMLLLLPLVLGATVWSFHARRKQFPYHNLPMLFAAQETSMLGIPLFMILFGSDQAYRVAVLDVIQAAVAYPTIAILTANTGSNPTPRQIIKKVFSSPLVIMCLLGLTLNLTGIGAWLDGIGIGGIITESTGFLAQPVSAIIIFTVGYNFSLASGSRKTIFKVCIIHSLMFIAVGLIIQLGLFLIPSVDPLTRWAILLYSVLPSSFMAASLGKTEEEFTVASGVTSILTAVCLLAFCVIAAVVA